MELRELIEMILEKDPETREDDKRLMLAVWKCQGLALTKPEIQYIKNFCAVPETVRRIRQKIQEEGHLWPVRKQKTFC